MYFFVRWTFLQYFFFAKRRQLSYWFHETAIALSLLTFESERNLQLTGAEREMDKVSETETNELSQKLLFFRKAFCFFAPEAIHLFLQSNWGTFCSSINTDGFTREMKLSVHFAMTWQLSNCFENGESFIAC